MWDPVNRPYLRFKRHAEYMAHLREYGGSIVSQRHAMYSRARMLGPLKIITPLRRIKLRRISLAN